jgi:histone H2A
MQNPPRLMQNQPRCGYRLGAAGGGAAGGGAAGRGGFKGRKSVSRSKRAGLKFPVGRIHRYLKAANPAPRIGAGAPVYLAAVLEYIAAELLELSGSAARDDYKCRITPRHIKFAVDRDEELDTLFDGVTIKDAGVVPLIHKVLLPKKGAKRSWTGKKYPPDFYIAKAAFGVRGISLQPEQWHDQYKGEYQKARMQFYKKTDGRKELGIARWIDSLH